MAGFQFASPEESSLRMVKQAGNLESLGPSLRSPLTVAFQKKAMPHPVSGLPDQVYSMRQTTVIDLVIKRVATNGLFVRSD